MEILVVTSCTSRKRDCEAPAAEMYTGAQHGLLMERLEQVWKIYGKRTIDLAIISAKYGLLNETVYSMNVMLSFLTMLHFKV
ncbi:MAG: hypothetical protein OYL97_00620 [Candidatus Poribacteria bacterium]|nr:hypothetical protein [Candidatus Poribacteria bacterium]